MSGGRHTPVSTCTCTPRSPPFPPCRREPRRYATLVAAALVAKSQSALLTIVIPCYTKHHGAWKRLMGTILDGGHRHRDGAASATFYYPSCDFDAVSTRTIVSTMAEKALFSGSLIHFKNSTGPYDGEVSTLAETLRVAGAHGLSPAQTMDANMESMFNVIHREGTRGAHWPAYRNGNISTSMSMGTNKYWLQSMKKMYGCAAWGGNGTDDLCFMLDADSHVRRPLVGLCAVASHYQRHNRTVLVRPGATFERSADGQFGFGKYTRVVELSRDLLSTAHPETSKLRGAQFGEFYALELYHWMWTPSHVRLFLERAMDGSMAKLALSHPSKYTGECGIRLRRSHHLECPHLERPPSPASPLALIRMVLRRRTIYRGNHVSFCVSAAA